MLSISMLQQIGNTTKKSDESEKMTSKPTRRETLGTAAAVFGGSIIGSKVVVADGPDDESYSGKRTFFELKYEHKDISIPTNSVECGYPTYYLSGSSLYIGDTSIEPVRNSEAIATNGVEFFEMPHTLFKGTHRHIPVLTRYRKESSHLMELVEDHKYPTISVQADELTAVLTVNEDQYQVQSGDEKIIELEEVEISVPTFNQPVEVENTREVGSDTITLLKETDPERYKITPIVGLRNWGLVDVYGIEEGVVIPGDLERRGEE